MRLLAPQRLRPHYYEGVEQALREAFAVFLFRPLEVILLEGVPAASGFLNTAPLPSRELVDALRRGTIQYNAGLVTGEFDAATTKALRALGAEPTTHGGVFAMRLPDWAAPGWLKQEAAAAQRRAEAIHEKFTRELNALQERLDAGQMAAPIPAADMVEAVEDGFETAAGALGLTKRIPAAARAAMEARYAADVRPYVAEATAEYIEGLHKAVADNAARGYRYEALVEDLQHYLAVSERKARFLARQETSLFMAGYRRARFEAAGVTRYRWSTSHDIRVRPYADETKLKKYGDHRALDKQVFTYDQKAPASFMSSKKPCNPGEDFGCRCVDLAVIE